MAAVQGIGATRKRTGKRRTTRNGTKGMVARGQETQNDSGLLYGRVVKRLVGGCCASVFFYWLLVDQAHILQHNSGALEGAGTDVELSSQLFLLLH